MITDQSNRHESLSLFIDLLFTSNNLAHYVVKYICFVHPNTQTKVKPQFAQINPNRFTINPISFIYSESNKKKLESHQSLNNYLISWFCRRSKQKKISKTFMIINPSNKSITCNLLESTIILLQCNPMLQMDQKLCNNHDNPCLILYYFHY